MQILPLSLPGCYELRPRVWHDARGSFVKTFNCSLFHELGLPTDFREHFYSVSRRHVLRGMHFQVAPMDHAKLVSCPSGRAFDGFVDVRRGSPTYGQHAVVELSASAANMVYLPPGIAHGFLALTDDTIVAYNVTTEHSPQHDAGLRWDTVGIPWPVDRPQLSERDARFISFQNFDSPFVWQGNAA